MAAESSSFSLTSQMSTIPDDTTRRLAEIWRKLLHIDSVGLDQNYFDLGGDSSIAVQLFNQIDSIFNVKLPLATLFDAPTVAELAKVVRRKSAEANWSSLVPIQRAGSRPPLFCVHGAGGNVLIYQNLSRHLGPDQPVYGLQCQGLDGKQPLVARVEDMAAIYVREIQQIQPQGPYFLAGYCMGGSIAYEIAQQLRAEGEAVAMVALFDTINWSKVTKRSRTSRLKYQMQRLWFHLRNFVLLNSQEKVRFVREKWNELKRRAIVWRGSFRGAFTRSDKSDQSKSLLLSKIWKMHDAAALHYVPRPLDARIVAFRPLKQYSMVGDTFEHWDKLALRGQDVVTLPVYPAGMLVEPFVQKLATTLRQHMDTLSCVELSR